MKEIDKIAFIYLKDGKIQEIRWLDYSNLDIISPVDKLIFKDLYDKKLIK